MNSRIITDPNIRQERYLKYLKQQSYSVLLSPADRYGYSVAYKNELEKMKLGKGKHQLD